MFVVLLATSYCICYNESQEKDGFGDDMGTQKPRGDMQEKILTYIQAEIKRRGYAPSVREIGEAVGLKSPSTVHGHLTRLEKKGLLHRDAMKPRAMGLSSDKYAEPELTSPVTGIPLVGNVAAGIPILAEENTEAVLPLPADFVGDGELFMLCVRGDSMINAGILNGDYLVVRSQPNASNGEIVVALIDNEATVKRFYKENGYFRLQPENDYMEPIIVQEVTILGKVVSLLRKI